MLVSTTAPRLPRTRRPGRPVSTPTTYSSLDQVSLGSSRPKHETRNSKVKLALIGGALGGVAGALGGMAGGPLGGIAAAPLVGLIGGAAAASAFKFSKSGEQDEKAAAQKKALFIRTAAAGLVGAAVVGLGVSGGVPGAIAAGVGGLATGAALGYGFGS